MKTYRVKEIFGPTLQGEGLHSAQPCVFVRLSGCNAWNGKADSKATSACPYCDTDFFGGDELDCEQIVAKLTSLADNCKEIGCVLTGGEPLLQADMFLLAALGEQFAWVDIETNGTQLCPDRPDNVFISCSPKRVVNTEIILNPDWWKILIPEQESFLEMACASDKPVFVQPVCYDNDLQGDAYKQNMQRCIDLCYARGLRLSVQLHKYLDLE
ncbi:MAG: hypothetical protein HRU15_03595 [Planctomycetes bacterium]|nr:hypothetical protein [Planctomycetota bacterium]